MRALVVFFGLILFGATATAQYDYNDEYGTSYDDPDRYFYDENFDWRWDVRVRISDGIDNGSLTRREADRLYNKLEHNSFVFFELCHGVCYVTERIMHIKKLLFF